MEKIMSLSNKKTGIFGGSFNPPHLGHINAVSTVVKKIGLDRVHIVPAYQNPLKRPIEGATAEDRLTMVQLAFESYGPNYNVDDREVTRKGKSFTIDTILEYRKDHEADSLFMILGLDAFEDFGSWKDYSEILKNTNLVVVTRPGCQIPHSIEELPDAIKIHVDTFDFNFVELKSGRNIQFVSLNDIEISGAELRKKIRASRNTEKYLPLSVEKFIKERHLYKPLGSKVGDYEKFTRFCIDFLLSKKSINIRAFDLRAMQAPSEFTLVTSGTSTRHTVSLAENLIQAVKEEYGVYPQSLEGIEEGRWVLVDYGSLIVHFFYDFVRNEYQLENLWKDGKEMKIQH
jgi:nicotinate-nucleotide adenylyltransferase